MCLLIVKQENADIEQLLNDVDVIHAENADGFGVAWFSDGAVQTSRGFMGPAKQRETIQRLAGVPAVFHWRFGTSGKRNESNCHPFRLSDGSAFAHNGIIVHPLIVPTKKRSDTATLASMAKDADELLGILVTIDEQKALGGNRFALMRPNGDVQIVNEDYGDWIDGIWYSNQNYLLPPAKKVWTPSDYDFPTVGGHKRTDLDMSIEFLVEKYGYRDVIETIENLPFSEGYYR